MVISWTVSSNLNQRVFGLCENIDEMSFAKEWHWAAVTTGFTRFMLGYVGYFRYFYSVNSRPQCELRLRKLNSAKSFSIEERFWFMFIVSCCQIQFSSSFSTWCEHFDINNTEMHYNIGTLDGKMHISTDRLHWSWEVACLHTLQFHLVQLFSVVSNKNQDKHDMNMKL